MEHLFTSEVGLVGNFVFPVVREIWNRHRQFWLFSRTFASRIAVYISTIFGLKSMGKRWKKTPKKCSLLLGITDTQKYLEKIVKKKTWFLSLLLLFSVANNKLVRAKNFRRAKKEDRMFWTRLIFVCAFGQHLLAEGKKREKLSKFRILPFDEWFLHY